MVKQNIILLRKNQDKNGKIVVLCLTDVSALNMTVNLLDSLKKVV